MTLQTGQSIMGGPRRWDILANFMLEQGYKTFVEVGCKEGRTTGHILKNVPDSQVVAIDPWITQEASQDPTKETYRDWDFSKIEAEFNDNTCSCNWDKLTHQPDCSWFRCSMMRMTSEEAAWSYFAPFGRTSMDLPSPPSPLPTDLVFLDALHDYEHVRQDIALWWPKVRIGGMLTGHDFNHKWPGVERAVAEAFNLMHVGVAPDSVWYVVKRSEDQCRL